MRFAGTLLPEGEFGELFVVNGRLRTGPVPNAQTVSEGGYLLPGLVDAHCHVGIGPEGPVDLDEAHRQAEVERETGVLLLRDCGAPIDTTPLQRRLDLPRIVRSGRHIARPRRYIRYLGVELEDPSRLSEAVAEQAEQSDGWVKLVGDWIDRERGDLAPLWTDRQLAEAISVAHDHGAKVTAHVFGEEALPGLVGAGIDCIEHGTGLGPDGLGEMARRGTALVPTLVNIETFPEIADGAARYPAYARHMRALHAGVRDMVATAVDAGVTVYAGTDAGGSVAHGRIVDEIVALHEAGMSSLDAIGSASWAAREWLGWPGLVDGAAADLVVCDADPRVDPNALRGPKHVLLRGRLIR